MPGFVVGGQSWTKIIVEVSKMDFFLIQMHITICKLKVIKMYHHVILVIVDV